MSEKISTRQVWWCWIINDPFIPVWDQGIKNYRCPLCQDIHMDNWTCHDFICVPKQILLEKQNGIRKRY